jgi:hypothetical protein
MLYENKSDKITGALRKEYNEEIYNLYSSSDTVKPPRERWAAHVECREAKIYILTEFW